VIRRVLIPSAGALLGAVFYLVLIDTREVPELWVIPAVALLTGGAFALSGRETISDMRLSLRWLRHLWRVAVGVPLDALLLIRALLAQLVHPVESRGELRATPFKGGEERYEVGRIALAEAMGSLAPNTIVIGVDPETDLLLAHQLHRHGPPEELDRLRLG